MSKFYACNSPSKLMCLMINWAKANGHNHQSHAHELMDEFVPNITFPRKDLKPYSIVLSFKASPVIQSFQGWVLATYPSVLTGNAVPLDPPAAEPPNPAKRAKPAERQEEPKERPKGVPHTTDASTQTDEAACRTTSTQTDEAARSLHLEFNIRLA